MESNKFRILHPVLIELHKAYGLRVFILSEIVKFVGERMGCARKSVVLNFRVN